MRKVLEDLEGITLIERDTSQVAHTWRMSDTFDEVLDVIEMPLIIRFTTPNTDLRSPSEHKLMLKP